MDKIRVRLFMRKKVWYLRFKENGKEKWRSTGTSNIEVAEILKSEYENKLLKSYFTGQPIEKPKSLLITQLIRRYLEHSRVTNSQTTSQGDYYHLRPWLNFFARKGIKFLDQINNDVVQQFQVDSLQQNSSRTFNNQLGILKTALNKAVEWDLIPSNPILKAKKIKIPVKYHYFRPEEIEIQLQKASPYLKRLVGLGVYAGLRRGEMIQLKLTDIDYKKKEIKIRSEKDYTPKGKRPRTIPLNSRLLKILKSEELLKGLWVLPRTIEEGAPFNFHKPHELSWQYQKFLRKIGQSGKLHDLRHTFGTYAMASGVPIRDVQAWMGHSDIQSTMIYAHHAPDVNRDKIDLLPY